MMDSILHTTYFALAFLLLFASAELLYHYFKFHPEVTRKYVHVMTGLITLLFPVYIDDQWLVLILCTSFLVILLLSLKLDLLPSINKVKRTTRGSILYPITVYICYWLFSYFEHLSLFYVPILILAFCDPLAALIGKKWPYGTYRIFGGSKHISGSIAFLVVAFFISYALMVSLEKVAVLTGFFIAFEVALASAITEAVSHKGYDNITIPLATIIVLCLNLIL